MNNAEREILQSELLACLLMRLFAGQVSFVP